MLGTITLTVGQQETSNVTLNEEPAENIEVVANDSSPKGIMEEVCFQEATEATLTTPVSEDKESPEQTSEDNSNEVGFKKVFKFVGFKFTVKKDKTEKSDPVQLLTVKKEEVEANGTDHHEKPCDIDEEKRENLQETKEIELQSENTNEAAKNAETQKEATEENTIEKAKPEDESIVEKEPKISPESPTNPLVAETASPFKKFFTQGWAGLRKKTSFRKVKDEDQPAVEQSIKEETETSAPQESVTQEVIVSEEQPVSLPMVQSENVELQAGKDETPAEEESSNQECAEKIEMPNEVEKADGCVESVTEKLESLNDLVIETAAVEIVHEADLPEENLSQITEVISSNSLNIEAKGPLLVMASDTELCVTEVKNTNILVENLTDALPSSEYTEKGQEAIATEAELLSSQEKAKVQDSPLRKLFIGSGLRKLSGKKHKAKKEENFKPEGVTEQSTVPSEPTEAAGVNGGSSPSSPDESVETSPIEKLPEDAPQTTETENEGSTSEGERKKEGITPWASFKKMVTPKKRAKIPSESDKEDDIEKVKSATMSSTDSAASVEIQVEAKESIDEQKHEKSTEESKKKVDSSVSWEALICVGATKKRGRKTSDSEDDDLQKSVEENKKTEVKPEQTVSSEEPIASSQEKEYTHDSPSPEQASSPTEGDGVSTWQSFKRLVTPRRKSRTKVEDKIEEPGVVPSIEQPTSEGEAGKDESWVSLKKLIPGRKKKKSDGKLEQGALNEAGQTQELEAVEDDSDIPAVVPLSEFDAAEQEKFDALQLAGSSVIGSIKQQETEHEKSSEELIHAVTVTVIEGERAVTSLEERSPSWISATVTEQTKENQLSKTKEKIETEVIVEEAVIFGTVSQVMVERENFLTNEAELTSEALTALEEAIEISCAEEPTEMMSAVSQLDESPATTEDATPVPETNETTQIMEEQHKQVEHLLQAVAESTKLSLDSVVDTINVKNTITNLTQNLELEVMENILEPVTVSLQESTCAFKNLETTENVTLVDKQAVEFREDTINSLPKELLVNKTQQIYSILERSDEVVPNIADNSVSSTKNLEIICTTEGVASFEEAVPKSSPADSDRTIDLTDVAKKSILVLTKTVIENVPFVLGKEANESVSCAFEEQAKVPILLEKDTKSTPIVVQDLTTECSFILAEEPSIESVAILAEELITESALLPEKPVTECAPVLVDPVKENTPVLTKEIASESTPILVEEFVPETSPILVEEPAPERAPILAEEPAPERAPILAGDTTTQSTHVLVCEVATERAPTPSASAPMLNEESATESTPVLTEEQFTESAPVLALEMASEGAPVLVEELAPDNIPVLAEEPAANSDPVLAEETAAESFPILVFETATESTPILSEEASTEKAPVLTVEPPAESAPGLAVEPPAESAPGLAEEPPAESAPVLAEEPPAESAPVLAEEPPAESAPVLAEEPPAESAPMLAEEPPAESAPVLAEEPPAESAPVLAEEPPAESAPVLAEEPPAESAPVLAEEPPAESAPVLAEEPPAESAPVLAEEPPAESAPVLAEEPPAESAPVLAEEPPAESAPVLAEEPPAESAPVLAEEPPAESAPVLAEEPPAESAPVLAEEPPAESAPVLAEEPPAESAPVLAVEPPAESAPVLAEESTPESAPVLAEESTPESAPVLAVEPSAESAPVLAVKPSAESAPVLAVEPSAESAPVLAEESTPESAPVLAVEPPAESAPVLAVEPPAESAPVLAEESTPESAPVLAVEPPAESAPVLAEESTPESAPVLAVEPPAESAPVLAVKPSAESAPVLAVEPSAESAPVLAEESTPESAPVLAEESTPAESAPVLAVEPPAESAPVLAVEPPAESAPVLAVEPPAESAPVLAVEPPAESAPVLAVEPPAESAPVLAVEPPAESAPVLAVEPPAESAPVLAVEPPAESAPVLAVEPPAESAPVLAVEPPAESAPVLAVAPPAESAPVLAVEPPAESAPVLAVEPPAESAPVLAVEPPAESAPVLAVEPSAESAPVLAVEPSPESAPVLVEEPEHNFESSVKESYFDSTEEQTKKSAVFFGDHTKKVLSDVSISTKVQGSERAPFSAEIQAVDVYVLTEISAAEGTAMATEVSEIVMHTLQTDQLSEEHIVKIDPVLSENVTTLKEVKDQEGTLSFAEEVVSVLHAESDVPVKPLAPEQVPACKDAKSAFVYIMEQTSESELVLSVQKTLSVTGEMMVKDTCLKEEQKNAPLLKDITTVLPEEEKTKITAMPVAEATASPDFMSVSEISAPENVLAQVAHVLEDERVGIVPESVFDTKEVVSSLEAEEPEVLNVLLNQLTPIYSTIVKEFTAVCEEIVSASIPGLESSEANEASEPVSAATTQELVLSETAAVIETSTENLNLVQAADVPWEGPKPALKSVSQQAASIVDAAIQAATNCIVVNTTLRETVQENTIDENGGIFSEDKKALQSDVKEIVHQVSDPSLETDSLGLNNQNRLASQSLASELISEVEEAIIGESKVDHAPLGEITAGQPLNVKVEHVTKEPKRDSIEVVNTTAYREQVNTENAADPEKEVFVIRVELLTRGNSKEELTHGEQKDSSSILSEEKQEQTSLTDPESVQYNVVEQVAAECVQTHLEAEPEAIALTKKEEKIEVTALQDTSEDHPPQNTHSVES